MSNIVPFPSAGGSSHLGSRLLREPPAQAHTVQFYDDETFLIETVGFFLSAGIAAGEAALIIATPGHTHGILGQMHKDVRERALASGQLSLVDADAMLTRFMCDGEPIESSFEAAIERVFEGLFAREWSAEASPRGLKRVRAFGEMVDMLWKRGNPRAALLLEQFWNRVAVRHDLVLLCGYGMGNFYKADDTAQFREVCRLHTHVMPTEHFAKGTGDVFERLREISVLEQRARSLDSEVAYRAELEGVLREAIDERAPRSVLEPRAGVSVAARDGDEPCAPLDARSSTTRVLTRLFRVARLRLARWMAGGER